MESPLEEARHSGHEGDRQGRDLESGAKIVPQNRTREDVSQIEKDLNDDQSTLESTLPQNLIGWDNPEDKDPANPMNWSSRRKWGTVAVLSSITFLTPLASSMLAPGVPQIMEDFGTTSSTFATFVVSIFVLGFAFGPILLAPLSEMYGRVIVYNICNVCFVVMSILCAVASSSFMLLASRFCAGLVGVAVITCGSGTIADIMPREIRGKAMALWSLGPLLGPVIGPIAGGFLVEAKGWRWVFWVITICSSIITTISILILRETYPPVLLARKAARLRKQTGNINLRSKFDNGYSESKSIKLSIVRPVRMLLLSPILTMMCIYIAFLYGALYILFTTFTFVFEEVYQFSPSSAGLSFLGSGVGSLLGLGFAGALSDREIKAKISKGLQPTPEDRLPYILTIPASLALPIGLIIYGWSTDKAVHWIVPEIGTANVGFGMLTILMCVQTYLVDAFSLHAASATAANAILRSLLGALLPLCGLEMYHTLGLGWGNTLLGLIALVMAPLPIYFKLRGQSIRQNPKWQHKF